MAKNVRHEPLKHWCTTEYVASWQIRCVHLMQWYSKIHTWKTQGEAFQHNFYCVGSVSFTVSCVPGKGTGIRRSSMVSEPFGVTVCGDTLCSTGITDLSYIPHIHVTKPLFFHKSHHLQLIFTLRYTSPSHRHWPHSPKSHVQGPDPWCHWYLIL